MVCDTVEELKYLLQDENFGQDASFILQEKVNGVEVCFHAVIVEVELFQFLLILSIRGL